MTAVVGMIVPPAGNVVPPEAYGLYPRGVRFAARSLDLGELTLQGYSDVIDRVAALASELQRDVGADVISLMGTSLSFFRGGTFNDKLVSTMRRASGKPATTMSNAIRDALLAVGAHRVAVGTAYSDEVNAKLRDFLETSGFEVVHLQGLDMVDVAAIRAVSPQRVADLAVKVDANAGDKADAVLISCGGLPALDLAARVEPRIGKPVVASATAGVWASLRLLGMKASHPALGRLGQATHRAA